MPYFNLVNYVTAPAPYLGVGTERVMSHKRKIIETRKPVYEAWNMIVCINLKITVVRRIALLVNCSENETKYMEDIENTVFYIYPSVILKTQDMSFLSEIN